MWKNCKLSKKRVTHELGWQYKYQGKIGTNPHDKVADAQTPLELVNGIWRDKID
jgi:hypothetical protein